MSRTRQERRYLTNIYQKKQANIHHFHAWYSGYESRTITKHQYGRWKKVAAMDCGRAGCQMCCSPRRSNWGSEYDKYTLQEKRNYDTYISQLDDYYADDTSSDSDVG